MKGEATDIRVRKRKRRFARKLRKSETIAEAMLWKHLRKRQMCGLRFRRQVPIGNFIADFCCPRRKIIIEVDGGIHNKPEQREYDEMRDEALSFREYQVLRFKNEEVEHSLRSVLERIEHAINNKQKQ